MCQKRRYVDVDMFAFVCANDVCQMNWLNSIGPFSTNSRLKGRSRYRIYRVPWNLCCPVASQHSHVPVQGVRLHLSHTVLGKLMLVGPSCIPSQTLLMFNAPVTVISGSGMTKLHREFQHSTPYWLLILLSRIHISWVCALTSIHNLSSTMRDSKFELDDPLEDLEG